MNLIQVPGGSIAAYSFGQGDPVIFLHGGPGDTHDYMKRMAEPLFDKFQCIFFDQRGTGGSSNFKRLESEFEVQWLLHDLIAVSMHFEAHRPALVGHSWGAMYALFACVQFPNVFSKAALISMGPLDSEIEQQTSERLMLALSANEQLEWSDLRKRRSIARDAGDAASVERLDRSVMQLHVKTWLFNPDLRAEFLEKYFLGPPTDREVNKWIWSSGKAWFSWNSLRDIGCALWICTGANDSVPLLQTERILAGTKNATSTVLENCGHIPWLEHPDVFYCELLKFLTAQ